MLLPVTFGLPPVGALIMLAGIYYGAQYGGSTTAILVNIPGEVTSVVTTLDGHQMARQGRAGVALGIAALGSFFAGCVATLIIAALAVPLTRLALLFGPAEYAALMTTGLAFAVVLARGSILKSIAMVLLGLLLSTVGTDLETGVERMTFGFAPLSDGVDFAVLAMGLFGFAEVMRNLDGGPGARRGAPRPSAGSSRARRDLRQSALPDRPRDAARRGPGHPPRQRGGARPVRLLRAGEEARQGPAPLRAWRHRGRGRARVGEQRRGADLVHPAPHPGHPPQRGDGADGGRDDHPRHRPRPAGHDPEPARSSGGVIASMWIGNLMLLVINLPLIGVWVRLLKVPYRLMFPTILIFCCIGIYSVNNSPGDVLFTAGFALFGYAASRLGFESAPLLLGFVLGRLLEENLRRALAISRGDLADLRPAAGQRWLLLAAASSSWWWRCCPPSDPPRGGLHRVSARVPPEETAP